MKNRSFWIYPLLLAGLVLLLGSLWFFHYPPFGLIIFGIIFCLFVGSAWRYRNWLIDVEKQKSWMKTHADSLDLDSTDLPTEIQKRKTYIQEIIAREEDPYKVDFADLLSTRESARDTMFSGGTLIVLGLLGTFYGLLNVVSVAGAATASQHVDLGAVLPQIFANLQGIFGSSLSGLSASLLLTAMQGLWQSEQAEYLAEVEEFCRFRLLPKLCPPTVNKGEDPLLFEMRQLRKELRDGVSAPLESSLSEFSQKQDLALQGLQNTIDKTFVNLEDKISSDWMQKSSALLSSQQSYLENSQNNISSQWSKLHQDLQNSLQEQIKNAQDSLRSVQTQMLTAQEERQVALFQEQQNWSASLGQNQTALQNLFAEQLKATHDSQIEQFARFQERQEQHLADLLQSQKQILEELQNKALEILESQGQSTHNQSVQLQNAVQSLQAGIAENLPKIAEIGSESTKRIEDNVAEILSQQSKAYEELQKAQASWAANVQTMAKEWDNLREEGLQGLLDALRGAAEGSKDGLVQLSEGLESFRTRLGESLSVQERLALEWKSSLEELRVHQIDLQASMEFFRSGTEYMVEQFGSQKDESEELSQKQSRWEDALLAHAEKSAEILRENALRTREILIDALQRNS